MIRDHHRIRCVLALSLSGCSSILGIENFKVGDAGSTSDDAATVDAAAGCLGPDRFFVCDITASGPLGLDNPNQRTVDTDTDPRCAQQPASWIAADQPPACFLMGTTIRISVQARVTGSRPLVLVATDSISIPSTGAIDVAAHRGDAAPVPKGAQATCVPPTPAADIAGGTAGAGGAGGSFGSRGGDGFSNFPGMQNGIAAPVIPPPILTLRGGCAGGEGGRGGPMPRTPGGAGGGGVYLVAANGITIDGFINASGSGGLASNDTRSGGSGGGSGGMILLHATTIGGTGTLLANGGGGGAGTELSPAPPVSMGSDPNPAMPFAPANGGESPSGGPAGGKGFAGTTAAANATQSPTGNGGGAAGGGGAGHIKANVSLASLRVSPGTP